MSDSEAPWSVAHKSPPCKEFSKQEYWSGLPFPSPGDLPDPGTEPGSPALRQSLVLSERADGGSEPLLSVVHLNSTKLLDQNLPRPHPRGLFLCPVLICALYNNQASRVSCFPKFCELCQGVIEPERAASLCSLLVRSVGGLGALELAAGVWSRESLLQSEVCAHFACSV